MRRISAEEQQQQFTTDGQTSASVRSDAAIGGKIEQDCDEKTSVSEVKVNISNEFARKFPSKTKSDRNTFRSERTVDEVADTSFVRDSNRFGDDQQTRHRRETNESTGRRETSAKTFRRSTFGFRGDGVENEKELAGIRKREVCSPSIANRAKRERCFDSTDIAPESIDTFATIDVEFVLQLEGFL